MAMSVREKVREVVEKIFKVSPHAMGLVTDEINLKVLAPDSLAELDFILEIEKSFVNADGTDFEYPDEDVVPTKTISVLVSYLEKKSVRVKEPESKK